MKGEVQLEPSGERNPSDSDPLLENQDENSSPPSSGSGSGEINNEDIEAGSVPCCRICLECDGEEGLILFLNSTRFLLLVGFGNYELKVYCNEFDGSNPMERTMIPIVIGWVDLRVNVCSFIVRSSIVPQTKWGKKKKI